MSNLRKLTALLLQLNVAKNCPNLLKTIPVVVQDGAMMVTPDLETAEATLTVVVTHTEEVTLVTEVAVEDSVIVAEEEAADSVEVVAAMLTVVTTSKAVATTTVAVAGATATMEVTGVQAVANLQALANLQATKIVPRLDSLEQEAAVCVVVLVWAIRPTVSAAVSSRLPLMTLAMGSIEVVSQVELLCIRLRQTRVSLTLCS